METKRAFPQAFPWFTLVVGSILAILAAFTLSHPTAIWHTARTFNLTSAFPSPTSRFSSPGDGLRGLSIPLILSPFSDNHSDYGNCQREGCDVHEGRAGRE